MKALVTGAGGFIGSHLAEELINRGYAVRGLFMPDEHADHLEAMGVEVFRGDLTRPETLKGVAEGIDTVFHLATRTLDWGSRKLFERIMVDGTRNLLEESAASISRFVYFSSIAALGFGRDQVGADEDAERITCGIPYCDTKIVAEDRVKEFCGSRHIDYTIIRPANVIGPGSVWVREVLDGFMRGPLPLIAGGWAPGAFVYVKNLVDGTILAAESEKAIGRIYHFRDDYPITWGEYLKTLGGWVDKKPFGSIPFKLAWTLGSVCEKLLSPVGIRPPVTRLAAGVMGKNNDVDNTRAKTELGWASRVPLDQAMDEIKAWVMEHYRAPETCHFKEFHNRVVYITGGSSGIGLEIARLLAKKGAHLVLVARSPEKLEEARRQIAQSRRSPHQRITTLSVDVTDPDDVNKKMARAVTDAGIPDILINSAGIIASNYFESIPYDTFDAVMKTNVYGVRNVIAALLPAMKSRGGGKIVILASVAGLMGMFGYTTYATSKFAIVGFSECLRSELKRYNIAVSMFCPPSVKTPMIDEEAKTIPPESRAVKKLAGMLDPEYVARAVVKGICKKRFMIIPGYIAKGLYLSQRYLGSGVSRAVSDFVVKRAGKRAHKKGEFN